MTRTDVTQEPFAGLARYQARRFVPEGADLTEVAQVTDLCRKLLAREIGSAAELENWLLDCSEAGAVLDQAASILYIRMTCQTDDAARAAAYQAFVEKVMPAVKPLADQINRKYLEARRRYGLDAARYDVYDRNVAADVELFRQENVQPATELALLEQQYQTVIGAMTVEFDGAERTLPEMGRYLEVGDRAVRESAWRAAAERRLRDREEIDGLFDQMIALRQRIAVQADCPGFCQYIFREMHRFDYLPEDCFAFHRAVEEHVVPLVDGIYRRRREEMGLDRLRPWDFRADPAGRPPLRPFETPEQLVAGVGRMFERVDAELAGQFAGLAESGLLDLASRKGKAPGGYQATLEEARRPFIFMNAVGLDQDIWTLLHEGGHSFHSLAAAGEPLKEYRHAPLEFCEVASMGMELLAAGGVGEFYSAEEAGRSVREHLEGVITLLPWIATIDAYQHWIYTHPVQSQEERRAAWLEIFRRFRGRAVDWSALEEVEGYQWHRQSHIFTSPFYYIEYGIAQLGALQLWVRARRDRTATLRDYRSALALGGSRPIPELFAAAGIRFDFSAATVAPLARAVAEELGRL